MRFGHTFGGCLLNGVKQPSQRARTGSLLCLSPEQAANLPGYHTSEIIKLFCVKKDDTCLVGIMNWFELCKTSIPLTCFNL